MDTHRPLDVVADRKAETVTTWLTEHPGKRVICRDRAGAYGRSRARRSTGSDRSRRPLAAMAQPRGRSGENRCSPSPLPENGARDIDRTLDRTHPIGTTETDRRPGTHHSSGEFDTRHTR
ncbi:hypothetical protein R3Q16_31730 [Rhodococcus globerulus]|uniref:Transposase n=1 Tax=Rhodococcus globerulus TaxID=33008 RepID=A0ABU4C4K7_RHOGO|nr:hypothetical protein [Rhodococcus globerulus]MDV6271196.1 hypothetical protein [Rhodococcus globerulus]